MRQSIVLAHVVWFALAAFAPAAHSETYPTVPYRLVGGSTYQEGCFPPCDCPLLQEQFMTGTFDLVFYPFMGPLWTVGVEQVDWSVPALGKEITGQGIYRRAGELHEMRLDLQVDGEPPVAFDSGWVAGGDAYPFIDITLSMHGLYCYDIALHVRAKPVLEAPYLAVGVGMLSWSEVPGVATYDVLCGDLSALNGGAGVGASVEACLADDLAANVLAEDVALAAGEGAWFLVRPAGGSYDATVGSSPFACP